MNAILRTVWSKEAMIAFAALALGILMGIAAASGKPLIVALVGGALGTLALVAKPSLIFWTATFVTLVIAGLVKYFVPTLDRIWWLAYGMAFLLYLPAMLHVLNRKSTLAKNGSVLMSICVTVFLIDLLFATIAARSPVEQIAVASKTLLMFSGVWVYFAFGPLPVDTVWKWLKALLWIGLIQWIFALYQFFFVRAWRQSVGKGSVSAADSVVGTFGGSMDSGGLTAVLAFFLVASIVMLIAMRREKAIGRGQLALWGFLLFLPLMFMEVKIIFIYFPIALVVLFRVEILRRPHLFIGWSCVAAFMLIGMLMLYQTVHWSAQENSDLRSSVERVFSYSFEEESGPDAADLGVMTRRQTIAYWWRSHNASNFHEALIGHGLGASRTRGLALGEVAQRHQPWQIDRTGISQLLWDVGLIGSLAALGALYAMYRQGGRLSKSQALLPWQRGLARGIQAIAPLYFLSLLYRNDIPYAAPMMFLFMASFGLIAWLTKQNGDAPSSNRKRDRTAERYA